MKITEDDAVTSPVRVLYHDPGGSHTDLEVSSPPPRNCCPCLTIGATRMEGPNMYCENVPEASVRYASS